MPAADPAFADDTCKQIVQYYSSNPNEMDKEFQRYASALLDAGEVQKAWQVLLMVV
jgi:hypothetical protein